MINFSKMSPEDIIKWKLVTCPRCQQMSSRHYLDKRVMYIHSQDDNYNIIEKCFVKMVGI